MDPRRKTWQGTVERERGELWFKDWTEAGSSAKDREAWRERTHGPISLKGKGRDDDDDSGFPPSSKSTPS